MSFAGDTKAELCKIENRKDCCRRAECYGLWLFSKCFSGSGAAHVTENGGVARRMLELAAEAAGVSAELSYGISRRKNPAYRVQPAGDAAYSQLLEAFGHWPGESGLRINRAVLENDCCLPAFLRGAFLTCGTIADPNKEYHLEFVVPARELANSLYTLLAEIPAFTATPAFTRRNNGYVVYLKEAGQIEDLLTYLGAGGSAMELMQVRMYKEAKNDINRKANFETANMDKTYSASARQIAAIAALSDSGELDSLSDELKELARFRLENPDMTLRQISEALHVSRSGVNHRLQRLLELGAKYLQGED